MDISSNNLDKRPTPIVPTPDWTTNTNSEVSNILFKTNFYVFHTANELA